MIVFWVIIGGLLSAALAVVALPLVLRRDGGARYPMLAAGLVMAVGVTAVALYRDAGAPAMVAMETTRPEVDPETAALIGKLESLMEEHPKDPEGWRLLARAYAGTGQFDKAVGAYRRLRRLQPENVRAAMGLGGMLVMSHRGRVTSEAMRLFKEIRTQAPDMPMPRYYLGLGQYQRGEKEAAFETWLDLARALPGGSDFAARLRADLQALASELGRPLPEWPPAGGEEGAAKPSR